MWDMGKVSVSGVFNDIESSFCPTLIIPELFVIGEKTGFYTSLCPFEIQFKYQPQDYKYNGYTQNWTVSDVTFVNANAGWMKKLNKEFLLETYVRVNAVSAVDIERITFKPTVEFSWTSSYLDQIVNPEKQLFMPKALSIQAGAAFTNKNNFKPDFFITTSIDFVLFAELAGMLLHM